MKRRMFFQSLFGAAGAAAIPATAAASGKSEITVDKDVKRVGDISNQTIHFHVSLDHRDIDAAIKDAVGVFAQNGSMFRRNL